MKTSYPKPAPAEWYIVDAQGQVLGRLASEIATVLRGRHRPSYVPHYRTGDHVIVINAEKVKITGNKLLQKKYYRHAGYLGHLRETTMKSVLEKDPTKVLIRAVKGMMPKNLSREHILRQLHVFAGEAHTHEAQKPALFPLPL